MPGFISVCFMAVDSTMISSLRLLFPDSPVVTDHPLKLSQNKQTNAFLSSSCMGRHFVRAIRKAISEMTPSLLVFLLAQITLLGRKMWTAKDENHSIRLTQPGWAVWTMECPASSTERKTRSLRAALLYYKFWPTPAQLSPITSFTADCLVPLYTR